MGLNHDVHTNTVSYGELRNLMTELRDSF